MAIHSVIPATGKNLLWPRVVCGQVEQNLWSFSCIKRTESSGMQTSIGDSHFLLSHMMWNKKKPAGEKKFRHAIFFYKKGSSILNLRWMVLPPIKRATFCKGKECHMKVKLNGFKVYCLIPRVWLNETKMFPPLFNITIFKAKSSR